MNLSEVFIRRPIMTMLIMVSILFFGVLAYKALPVSDLPSVDYPTINIDTTYPGANPVTMANNVTAPLEKQFTTIEGIQTISSTSTTGSSSIVITFDLEKPIGEAAQDVQAAITAASQQLPQDLPYAPTYTKVNPSDSPILFLCLTSSTLNSAELYKYSDTYISERISLIDGVSQVQTYGYQYAVRLQFDPQKLAAKGIGISELGSMIRSQNVSLPTGTLWGGKGEFTINVDGQVENALGYNPLIIKNQQGAIVRVQDIGQASDSTSNDKYSSEFTTDQGETQPCVALSIRKQPNANAIAVIDTVRKMLPKIASELPASIIIHNLFDKSNFIREAVADVQLTVFISFLLVIAIIYIYLGKLKDTIIPTVTLPISVIGTFIFLYLFKFNIDILSLLAITLSIGFLVDDAIVVLENIARHVEMGETPLQAALNASKEISLTILSMTLCLACVFIPMLFLGGVVGKIFREFSATIFIAVLISGFVSLSLTPMLASRFVPPKDTEKKKSAMERFSEKLNSFFLKHYETLLHWSLSHKKTILCIGAVSLIAAIFTFQKLPKDFFPPDDLGIIQGFTQANDGTSPFQMIDYQRTISKMVQENPGVESLISFGASQMDNQGYLFIHLKPPSKRPPILDVISELYGKLYNFPGAQSFFKSLPLINLQVGTTSSTGDYQYTLESIDTDALYKSSYLLFEKMKKLPGLSQVSTDLHINQPQLHIEIERDKASLLNISAADIENALGLAFAGGNLSPISQPENQYYVIMEVEPKFYNTPKMLSQIWIKSSLTGSLVPLSEISRITETVGPLAVNHIDALPSVTISFNLEGLPLGTAIKQIDEIARQTLPATVSGSVQGTADIFSSSFANMTYLLLITIFVIYIILGVLYENLFHPITVMTTLPPAALGGLLMLYFTGNTFSLYGFVGIILLLGIVLKNGIIMIDFANDAILKDHKKPEDAITHACLVRFRPILMTTLAALMGAIPIALGVGGLAAQSRKALGLVVIGGLIFSQILTLFFTPVVYVCLEKIKEKWMNHGRG